MIGGLSVPTDPGGGASGREYFGAAHRLNGFAFCDAS